ncbi:MAG: 2-amino-4-hydroxy-6-hydroxymethyldihydropteridine diphosphokinase [Dethiobacter sp.]|jgi:2-amino-4-hydroxy-6-hydroxymethyldihydropteridine diphosphokinase|nr:MAG: 2-amino-4-hydroxy-6-hydroxymethyldihydropteridine diphosphokinase [Dethiobacter sp.]
MYFQGEKVVSYIGLGSNLGNRKDNICKALKNIENIKHTKISKTSSFYENEPVGYTRQGKFVNCVAEVLTLFSPQKLLEELQKIENLLKRKRVFRWGPRTIDLDILFYGDSIIKEEKLVIPHERLTERAFVLVPLAEIAPDFINPETGKKISQHLIELGEIRGMNKF